MVSPGLTVKSRLRFVFNQGTRLWIAVNSQVFWVTIASTVNLVLTKGSHRGEFVIQPTTPADENGLSTESCRALIERITATPGFTRSERLSHFLKYAFQKTLEGRLEQLSEYQIGLNVFGRSERYSPGEDSIVRSHARLLRQRLEAYFESEGKAEEIRVSIPKGRYSLHFEQRAAEIPAMEPIAAPAAASVELSPPRAQSGKPWRLRAPVVIVMSILVLSVVATFLWVARKRGEVDLVWRRVFPPNGRTIIVPADSTLALFEDLTNDVIPLSDYVNHNYHASDSRFPLANHLWASGRRYTSMADLQISSRLMRLPQAQGKEVVIRYARDLHMADLKGANCVLLGGVRANPWEEIFQEKLNFRIGYDPEHHENRVINVSPRHGEQASYNESSDSSYHRAYGLIALLPSLSSGTSIVIVQGTSTAGTEAAADLLFDDSRFEQFLRQVAGAAQHAPSFEVLLEAESVGGNAQQASVTAYRVLSASSQ